MSADAAAPHAAGWLRHPDRSADRAADVAAVPLLAAGVGGGFRHLGGQNALWRSRTRTVSPRGRRHRCRDRVLFGAFVHLSCPQPDPTATAGRSVRGGDRNLPRRAAGGGHRPVLHAAGVAAGANSRSGGRHRGDFAAGVHDRAVCAAHHLATGHAVLSADLCGGRAFVSAHPNRYPVGAFGGALLRLSAVYRHLFAAGFHHRAPLLAGSRGLRRGRRCADHAAARRWSV